MRSTPQALQPQQTVRELLGLTLGFLRRLHQELQPQEGARPISASAGQLYGTDGNPVVLKVALPCVTHLYYAGFLCEALCMRLTHCLQAQNSSMAGNILSHRSVHMSRQRCKRSAPN